MPWKRIVQHQMWPVMLSQNILPPFHPPPAGTQFPGIGEELKHGCLNCEDRPVFWRTPNPPQSLEHCYQATNNEGPFGWSHQHCDLIAVANNSLSSFHDTMHQTALLPLGEMCLQVTVGSGLPVAMQVRLILFPSLMEISEEISTILGDTVETKASGRKINTLLKHLFVVSQ